MSLSSTIQGKEQCLMMYSKPFWGIIHGHKQKMPYMAIHYMYPKWYTTVYIRPQIVNIGTMPFCFANKLLCLCSVFMWFVAIYPLLAHEGYIQVLYTWTLGVLSTAIAIWSLEYCNNNIEVATRPGNGTHTTDSSWVLQFTWQDKRTMLFALYCSICCTVYKCFVLRVSCLTINLDVMWGK